jgi:2-dehydro-3-deoxygluconokinase
MTVVTIGECLLSLVPSHPGPFSQARQLDVHAAGAEANVAVGLARLGRSATYVGLVGDDGPGEIVTARLRAEGVDTTHLSVDPEARTGLMLRELRGLGPSQVSYWRTGSAGSRLGPEHIEDAEHVIGSAGWLHLTGITPALSASACAAVDHALDLATAAAVPVSLDVNFRSRLWTEAQASAALTPLLPRCDVVFGSPEEVGLLVDGDGAEALGHALIAAGAGHAVIKLGASGALSIDRTGTVVLARGRAVPSIVDPVGAGDAFVAGWLDAHLRGASDLDALALGNVCGAFTIAASGDQTGLPRPDEAMRLLSGSGTDDVIR